MHCSDVTTGSSGGMNLPLIELATGRQICKRNLEVCIFEKSKNK
jgi:hypothetical protein